MSMEVDNSIAAHAIQDITKLKLSLIHNKAKEQANTHIANHTSYEQSQTKYASESYGKTHASTINRKAQKPYKHKVSYRTSQG